MPEANNLGFIPNFSSELNIESIISAPLVAASKANVVMVTGQTRFLLEYCFKENENNTHEPIMIQMLITKGVVDPSKDEDDPDKVKIVELVFTIPLLCLVPMNSLAIDKVSLDFDLEITSVTSKEKDDGINDKKAQLNGKIGNSQNGNSNDKSQYQSQSSSHLKVSINASSLPLPVGVLAVLDLYTKTIQPRSLNNKTTVSNS